MIDMIKIIKRGTIDYTFRCPLCGCEFTTDGAEIIREKRIGGNAYINCPECGNEIKVKEENQPISNKRSNDYYQIKILNYNRYNEILAKYNKSPEWLMVALTDDSNLEEFIGFEYENHKVGEIETFSYSSLIEHNGFTYIMDSQTKNLDGYVILDDWNYFLSHEKAEDELKREIRRNINYYFHRGLDEEFKKEANK